MRGLEEQQEQEAAARQSNKDKRKQAENEREKEVDMVMSPKMVSTSYVWRPQHAGISLTVTAPRTQSWLSSAAVWLFIRLFVVIRKKRGRCAGGGKVASPGVWD